MESKPTSTNKKQKTLTSFFWKGSVQTQIVPSTTAFGDSNTCTLLKPKPGESSSEQPAYTN